MLAASSPVHSLPQTTSTTTTLLSHHKSYSSLQCKPAKNMEEFNRLLPPQIEFIEGSSSGTLAVAEGRYEPINLLSKAPPKPDRTETPKRPVASISSPTKLLSTLPSPHGGRKAATLFPGGIDTSWPAVCNRASGLYNNGNTCFLNSALQCLLHTPPLLRLVLSHEKDSCMVDKFCMICSMNLVTVHAYTNKAAFSPSPISSKLQIIAKHMRKGRQEDSHEFLRYAIDALQKACLAGLPPKIDPKLAETTWVHKIFGGRLRSRVSCQEYRHNSDTYDRVLDLSLDIQGAGTLKDALRRFVAMDFLRGADQYKCEKCKKHVNAAKRFTIHEAPLVLTIHLKRFSPLGRKIAHQVNYDEQLSLKQYMSEGQRGPTYSLYGVICHAGGGPNSGHYYAFVKTKDGRWWEMNDESVTPVRCPTNQRNAYILFYLQNKGQSLEGAIEQVLPPPLIKPGIAANMKKRKERDESDRAEEDKVDQGQKVSRPFIGPLLPSASTTDSGERLKKIPRINGPDPQAAHLQSKIEAIATPKAAPKAAIALEALNAYDSDKEDEGVPVTSTEPQSSKTPEFPPATDNPRPKPDDEPPPPLSPASSTTATSGSKTVSPESFYASPTNIKKPKLTIEEAKDTAKLLARATIPIESTAKSHSPSLRSHGYVDPSNPFKNLHSRHKMKRRFAV